MPPRRDRHGPDLFPFEQRLMSIYTCGECRSRIDPMAPRFSCHSCEPRYDIFPPEPRWYCSDNCRDLHHDQVLIDCPARLLPRAASSAQQVFYTMMEQTWAGDMKDVQPLNHPDGYVDGVLFHEGSGLCLPKHGGRLSQFPNHKFVGPGEVAQKCKHAVLVDQKSQWSMTVMHNVVLALFKDLVNDPTRDIQDFTRGVAIAERRTVVHIPDPSRPAPPAANAVIKRDTNGTKDYRHSWKITLKDGQKYCLDVTREQWAFRSVPLTTWNTEHDTLQTSELPLGSHLDSFRRKVLSEMVAQATSLETEIGEQILCSTANVFDNTNPFGQLYLDLAKTLRMPKAQFENLSAAIVGQIGAVIASRMRP